MDQQRIGSFLKKLRKEKNLTQEQLAEQLNISGRTISRWETGTNMPDISLLVELANFYDVSIPEIIDGERKSETINEEVKETALKLSDYAESINQKIKMHLFWLTILALIGMIAFIIIEASGLDTPDSIYERIASAGLGLDFGMLIVLAMYLSGLLGKVKAKRAMLFCVCLFNRAARKKIPSPHFSCSEGNLFIRGLYTIGERLSKIKKTSEWTGSDRHYPAAEQRWSFLHFPDALQPELQPILLRRKKYQLTVRSFWPEYDRSQMHPRDLRLQPHYKPRYPESSERSLRRCPESCEVREYPWTGQEILTVPSQ